MVSLELWREKDCRPLRLAMEAEWDPLGMRYTFA